MKVDAVKTMEKLMSYLHNSTDVKNRIVQFFDAKIAIIYLAEMTDTLLLNEGLINPLLTYQGERPENITQALKKDVLSNHEINEHNSIKSAISSLLNGQTLVLVDNASQILSCDMEKIAVRAIAEPPTNVVIKGPREGFTESMKQNLALIRQRARTKDLVVETMEIGEVTKTKVSVVYFKSIADKRVVKQILRRLKNIKIDGVTDSHYLVSYLQKNPKSLFKQIGDTEKPDILVGKMLEGRVGILVDGSPIVLTIPFILVEDLQNSDDYYSQPIRVAFVRALRLVGVVLAVLLPGLYVALEKFHYKIIPTEFLVTIINTTQGIPFSPFMEVLFIILLFEIVYEANLRMPQYFGMATSIVGALILGDTAVNAGLVSPPAVMIVALSGITFYIVPSQAAQFSILRLIALVCGAAIGLYGIIAFCVIVVSYLSSFDSYGSAYLAPTAPYIAGDQKDFLVRTPIKEMTKRPKSIANNRENLDRRRTK